MIVAYAEDFIECIFNTNSFNYFILKAGMLKILEGANTRHQVSIIDTKI